MPFFSISVVQADQPHQFSFASGIKTPAGAKTRAGGMVRKPGMKAAIALFDPQTDTHTPIAERIYLVPGEPWVDLRCTPGGASIDSAGE